MPWPPGPRGPRPRPAAENALTGTLRSLFATVENYPELKSNQNVLELQEQLTTTENQISFARQHYNATVLDYNSTIATVPSVLIAGPFGFHERDFFDAEPEASQVPERRPRLRSRRRRQGRRRRLRRGWRSAADRSAPPPPAYPPQAPPPGYPPQPPQAHPPGYRRPATRRSRPRRPRPATSLLPATSRPPARPGSEP